MATLVVFSLGMRGKYRCFFFLFPSVVPILPPTTKRATIAATKPVMLCCPFFRAASVGSGYLIVVYLKCVTSGVFLIQHDIKLELVVKKMNIFNRKELCITKNLTWLAQVRNCLEENNITYVTTSDFFSDRRRTRGVPFINREYVYDYYIYVHRKNYERARYLIANLKPR